MLEISPIAAEAIRAIAQNAALPEDAGLRIALGPEVDEGQLLSVDITAAPHEDDQVVDAQGAHVFVEPNASPMVDDMVLDATMEDDGVRFTLVPQGGDLGDLGDLGPSTNGAAPDA